MEVDFSTVPVLRSQLAASSIGALVPGAELALAGHRATAKGVLPGAERLESRPPQPPLERDAVGRPLRGRVAAEHVGRVVLGDRQRGQVRVEVGEPSPIAGLVDEAFVDHVRLEQQQRVRRADVVDAIEREQRVAEVVDHAEEEDEVEGPVLLRIERVDVLGDVRRLRVEQLGGDREARVIGRLVVEGDDLAGAAPFRLEREEAVAGADVEHAHPGEVLRHLELRQGLRRVVHARRPDPRRDLDPVVPDVLLRNRLLRAPCDVLVHAAGV